MSEEINSTNNDETQSPVEQDVQTIETTVTESHAIYGKYDFMISMESSSQDELKSDIFALRKMSGVTSTLSMMVIE